MRLHPAHKRAAHQFNRVIAGRDLQPPGAMLKLDPGFSNTAVQWQAQAFSFQAAGLALSQPRAQQHPQANQNQQRRPKDGPEIAGQKIHILQQQNDANQRQ